MLFPERRQTSKRRDYREEVDKHFSLDNIKFEIFDSQVGRFKNFELRKETQIGDVHLEVISAYVMFKVQVAKDARVEKEGTFSGIEPWGTPKLRGQGEKKEAKEIWKEG